MVGGERSVWGETINHWILYVLEQRKASGRWGRWVCWRRGRHVGGGCGGLWVVNAVKAQNQTEQEGAPPNADPGGSADIDTVRISRTNYEDYCEYLY